MNLVTALGLFLLVGLSVADLAWTPQKEYEYEYHGRLMTGIPDLAPHFAGLAVKCRIIVQAKEANKLHVKAKDFTIGKVNDVIAESWKDAHIPATMSLPSNIVRILETPIIANLNNGVVQSAVASGEEPVWSLNWKKALLSLLQVNLAEAPADISGNDIPKAGGPSKFYKTTEAGVGGECETIYQVASLPQFMVVEHPEWVPVADACTGGQYLEIIKTKNFDKCQKRAAFHRVAPGALPCQPGKAACEDLLTRTAMSRYIACGTPTNFAIQKVFSECETATNILGYKTEKALSASKQILTLAAIRPVTSVVPHPANPTNIPSLIYQLPTSNRGDGSPSTYDSLAVQKIPAPSLDDAPSAHITEAGAHIEAVKKLSPSELKEKARRLLKEAADEVEARQNPAEKHTAMKVMALAELLGLMGKQDIQGLFSEEADVSRNAADQKKQTVRHLFLDAAAISGTNPSIIFIKDLIQRDKLSEEEAAQALMVIPMYAKTPTVQLMEKLMELVTGRNAEKVQHTAALMLGTLVNRACIHPEMRKARYPVGLYGELCNPNADIIQRFIQTLRQRLEGARNNGEIILHLKAFGNLGHKDVIPILRPYIEGKVRSPHVRAAALFSLARVARNHKEEVLPICLAITNNLAEDAEIRMSAISMLAYLDGPVAHWQALALRTWFEPNHQVAAFIYTTIASLAKCKDPVHSKTAAKAAVVLPLALPITVGLQHSQNRFISQYLEKLELGLFQTISWVDGKDSIIPHNFLFRDTHQFGPFYTNVHHLNIFAYGVEEVLAEIYREVASPERQKYREDSYFSDALTARKIKEKLQIEPRAQLTPEGSVNLGLLGEMERFFFFDKDIARHVIEGVKSWSNALQAGYDVNYQKSLALADIAIMFPSEMGIPHLITVKMPAVLSVRGRIHKEAAGFVARMKPLATVQIVAQTSLVSPFTNEAITAGVDKHLMIHAPIEVQLRPNARKGSVVIAVKPAAEASQVEIAHFHSRPFAARKDILDFTPVTAHPETRIILATSQPAKKEFALGDTLVGMRFNVIHRADRPVDDFAALYHEIRPYTPMALLHYWWTKPSLSMQELRVIFDANNSPTKEIEAEFTIGVASKYKYSTSKEDTYADPTVKDNLKKVLDKLDAGSVFTATSEVRMKGRSLRHYKMDITAGLGSVGLQQKISIHVERKPVASYNKPFQLCVDGNVNFPKVPVLDRAALLSANLQSFIAANIGFGESCDANKIDISSQVTRSNDALEAARSSAAAAKCDQQEREGIHYSYQCRRAKLQAAAFNHYDIKIKYYKDLPDYVVNKVSYMEDALKAALLPYLSENVANVRNADHEVHVKVEIKPTMRAADITVLKPTANTVFRNVRVPVGINGIYGINARHSLIQQGLDELGAGQFHPVCSVEKDVVRTFERKQYKYQLNDCPHVLLQDCSSRGWDVAVLAKKAAGKHAVQAILGDHRVEVIPESSYFSGGSLKVKVNGQDIQVSDSHPAAVSDRNGDVVAEVQQTADGAVLINAARYHLQVVVHKDAVILKASHLYRSRACGLCGEMSGRRDADLRSPKKCVLSSPHLVGYSYMVKDASCSASIPQEQQRKLQEEQQRCLRDDVVPTKVSGVLTTQQDDCTEERHIVMYLDGKQCFSQEKVPQCKERCRATTTKPMKVYFHCISPGRLADYMISKAEQGKELPEIKYKSKDASKTMYIPDQCVP